MKSKITTYLLIVAVAAVWGVIAWKVLHPDDAGTGMAQPQPKPAVTTEADTLQLDYRDPFLGGRKPVAVVPVAASLPVMQAPPPTPKPAVQHNIRYLGRIRRQGVEYSLAEIDGVLHTLRQGETAGAYRLERIFPDSLHFIFEGERCCIKLSQ